ncbi:MAG: uracil-DNA glycosylase, partial [Clostridia bacterium]
MIINNEWDELLNEEFSKDYFLNLRNSIDNEYKKNIIFPKRELIFNAFKLTSYNNIKVVILGQDPYHGENEAMGLSFSVPKGVKIPPSLRNIYKEIKSDLNIETPNHGDLTSLAKEGVFFLNTILTVRKDSPLSHQNIGWEIFTDKVIALINNKTTPVVFILW